MPVTTPAARRRGSISTRALLGAGAAAAALVAGTLTVPAQAAPTATAEEKALDAVAAPKIAWTACGGDAPAAFQCAVVEVPTDYDEPDGDTTTLALTRLPASDGAKRKGSLFYNFGGPGGPAIDTLQQAYKTLASSSVRARYDLVGMDPRAVGASTPATCYANPGDEEDALAGVPGFPVTAKEEAAFLTFSKNLAASCRTFGKDRIEHASTANVARDLDLLRRAVGDTKLNYVGYSYGTYLGATYSRLFPSRVGKFVLDGTLDTRSYAGVDGDKRSAGARIGQGPAAAETFEQFLDRCGAAGPACSINSVGDPRTVVEEVWAKAKKKPITLPQAGSATFRYSDIVSESFFAMYSPAAWTSLADFYTLLATADGPSTRSTTSLELPSEVLKAQDYPSLGGSLASLCVDAPSFLKASGYAAQADREDEKAPGFGRMRSWVGIQCEYLGLTDTDRFRGPWKQTTDATVMVVGTRYDPATPYENTRPYADDFADARMVTVDGYGHTAVGLSTCVADALTRYLVSDRAPKDGTTCAQSVQPFTDDAPAAQRAVPLPAPGVGG